MPWPGWAAGIILLSLVLVGCASSSQETGLPAEGQLTTSVTAAAGPPADRTPSAAEGTPAAATQHSSGLDSLPDDPRALMFATLDRGLNDVLWKMSQSGNTSYIPVILEFMRFQQQVEPRIALASLVNKILEGPDEIVISPERADWGWWVEWLGNHSEVQPPDGYADWKGQLYSILDPGMGSFLYEGVKTRIRLEEIVWGGVKKDGIPDLTNPPVLPGGEATYLEPSDRVFGISINGEHRAYPMRILNFHEMANDVVGGVPFSLAY